MTLGLLGDLALCAAIILIGIIFLKANLNYLPEDEDKNEI
jgi:hypothetical protein